MLACCDMDSKPDLVQLLLNYEADGNVQDNYGDTALMLACL